MGTWIPTSTKLLVISVYAPQELIEKRQFWEYLAYLVNQWDVEIMILGDFNEVRAEYERFLVTEGLMLSFPHLSAICLDNNLSDHRPILMTELNVDYRVTLFRVFHSRFNKEGFDKVVKNSWKILKFVEANVSIQKKLSDVDKVLDQGGYSDDTMNYNSSLLKELQDINLIEASNIAQKAKVRWFIERDENSKYFHGILNKKRSQLAIRRVLADGEWLVDPSKVEDWNVLFLMMRLNGLCGNVARTSLQAWRVLHLISLVDTGVS
ncbi:RNA-directed DNA polymerase, eukaryota [Tanacetum coccineum]